MTKLPEAVIREMRLFHRDSCYPECGDESAADAAACYASTDRDLRSGVPFRWPWSSKWWKPKDRRRDLVRAGALIVAEIKRLERASRKDKDHDNEH